MSYPTEDQFEEARTHRAPPAAKVKWWLATIAEDFESFVSFDSAAERSGFADGFSAGAGHYGAGAAFTFNWPEDCKEFEAEYPAEYEDAMNACPDEAKLG
jgi:hypothetical protein